MAKTKPRSASTRSSHSDLGDVRFSGEVIDRLARDPRSWTASVAFGQQFSDSLLQLLLSAGFVPIELAEPPISDPSILIDQVDGGPHGVAPSVPRLLSLIDHNRIFKAMFLDILANIAWISLLFRFRRMDSQDCKLTTGKRFFPTLVPRVIAYAIDSAIGKEVKGNHFASQIAQLQTVGVDPLAAVDQFRCFERGLP